MPRIKPILFNAEMVRALIDGTRYLVHSANCILIEDKEG